MENELPTLEEIEQQEAPPAGPFEKPGSTLPLMLTIVSVFVWFAFQTVQLVFERNNLSRLKSNLEAPAQEAQKVQSQFQTLITKTAELASQGNAGARAVLEERGIPVRGAPPPAK